MRNNNITIAFVGDSVPCNITKSKYVNGFSEVYKQLSKHNCDNFVFNLEASLASKEATPNDTGSSCVFGELSILEPLLAKFGSFLSCSLANNHITDYGMTSLENTLNLLKKNSVGHFGAGLTNIDALKPLILSKNGIDIGFLSVCSTRKCVGDHLKLMIGGPISLLDNSVPAQIRALKQKVDHVIVACHWGREFVHYPIPEDRTLAKSFIDAGASLVVGHHPHVLQGYEEYKNSLIFYSLGNFLFPPQRYPQILRWSKIERTGAIAIFNFSKSDINLKKILPVRLQKNNNLKLLNSKEKDQVNAKILEWSSAFTITKYCSFYDRKIRSMLLIRTMNGIFRNILHPRKKHFLMIYRHFRQLLAGRKYFVD